MKIVLTRDGSRTLYCEKVNESFHSESGALSEALNVYLGNSGVRTRLVNKIPTRILEVGLGTGLNFLVTASAAIRLKSSIHYVGLDTLPATDDQLDELGYRPMIQDPVLFEAWEGYLDSVSEMDPADRPVFRFEPYVHLETVTGRAEVHIRDPDRFSDGGFDCVYLDAFSPAASVELWTSEFLGELHRVLARGGTLATYCVKSEIRRRMTKLGFQVSCLPGPEGGKRQVLVARK